MKIPVTEQIVKYSDRPVWHQKIINHLKSPFFLEKFSFAVTINYILKYVKIEKCYLRLCNITVFSIKKCSLGNHNFFQKH